LEKLFSSFGSIENEKTYRFIKHFLAHPNKKSSY